MLLQLAAGIRSNTKVVPAEEEIEIHSLSQPCQRGFWLQVYHDLLTVNISLTDDDEPSPVPSTSMTNASHQAWGMASCKIQCWSLDTPRSPRPTSPARQIWYSEEGASSQTATPLKCAVWVSSTSEDSFPQVQGQMMRLMLREQLKILVILMVNAIPPPDYPQTLWFLMNCCRLAH